MAKKKTSKNTNSAAELDDLTGEELPAELADAEPEAKKEDPSEPSFNQIVAKIMESSPRLPLRAARRKAVHANRAAWIAAGRPRV